MSEDDFNAIYLGQKAQLEHKITEQDLQSFVELSGDNNPLHVDKNFAAHSRFGKRVVHGMLSASFISTIIGTKLPGKGALWQSMNVKFLHPTFIGDVIVVSATVKHKSESQRVVVLELEVTNQHAQKLIEGEAEVRLLKPKKQNLQVKKMKKDKNLGAAIITGASSGIGAAIARKLAADGFTVIINYKSSGENAEQLKSDIQSFGGSALCYKADVADDVQVKAMFEDIQKDIDQISVVVNNASPEIIYKSFSKLDWSDIQTHYDVQVKGAFNICKNTLPIFEKQCSGNIINILSICLDDAPPENLYDYTMAKSALHAMCKSLAVEYGKKGIRVNNVAPGMTETKLISNIPERAKLLVEATSPLRRMALPDDIAAVVSFLVSESARYMTGQTIRVCGGQTMT